MNRKIAIAAAALLWGSAAFGQANNSNTWQTPGNQTVGGFVQMGVNGSGLAVGPLSGGAGYPPGAAPVGGSGTATTGGITSAIAGVPGQFTYLCGFSVSPGSATTAITIAITIAGTVNGGPFTWSVGAPVTAVGTTAAAFMQTFTPCVRTTSTNQNIILTVGALGVGGVNQSAQLWGYTQ